MKGLTRKIYNFLFPGNRMQRQLHTNDLEDSVSAMENTLQDFGYRLEQLELNTDLEDRIRELEQHHE